MKRSNFIAVAALCATALTAPHGHAYTLLEEGGICPNGIRFVVDQPIFTNVANAGASATALDDAVTDITDRINAVGGVWFDFNKSSTLIGSAYTWIGSDTNLNGLNEVGFADLSGLSASGNLLGKGPTLVDAISCMIITADVYLDSTDSWDFGVPFDGDNDRGRCDTEECYFDVSGMTAPDGDFYLRPILLHELGHNLGLAHEDSDYSFMNTGARPWTNRADHKRVEYLPDDREALRFLYPGTATERDVAVTVTWPSTNVSSGRAEDKLLCKPSKGDDYSSDIFSETCGVNADGSDGSLDVCPGDRLYVRYTLANYSNVDLEVTEELWFSKNTWLNRTAGVDLQSPTQKSPKTVNANRSHRMGRKYDVPDDVQFGREYYPILFADSGADFEDEESQQNNWIPLRTRIRVKDMIECLVASPGPVMTF